MRYAFLNLSIFLGLFPEPGDQFADCVISFLFGNNGLFLKAPNLTNSDRSIVGTCYKSFNFGIFALFKNLIFRIFTLIAKIVPSKH